MTRVTITNLTDDVLAVGNPDEHGKAFAIEKGESTVDLTDSEFLHTSPQLNALKSKLLIHYKTEKLPEAIGMVQRKEAAAEEAQMKLERMQAEADRKSKEAERVAGAADKTVELTRQEEEEKAAEALRIKEKADATGLTIENVRVAESQDRINRAGMSSDRKAPSEMAATRGERNESNDDAANRRMTEKEEEAATRP